MAATSAISTGIFSSGLTEDKIHQCLFILQQDSNTADAFRQTAMLVEHVVLAITVEMDSIRKDIQYWTHLLHASPLFAQASNLYIGLYRQFIQGLHLSATRLTGDVPTESGSSSSSFRGAESPTDRLDIKNVDIQSVLLHLRSEFYSLAMVLAGVHAAAGHLKSASMEVLRLCTLPGRRREETNYAAIAREQTLACLHAFKRAFALRSDAQNFVPRRHSSIENIISFISPKKSLRTSSFLALYRPAGASISGAGVSTGASTGASSGASSGASTGGAVGSTPIVVDREPEVVAECDNSDPANELTCELLAVQDMVHQYESNANSSTDYPLGVTPIRLRRPTSSEQYWLPNLVLSATCVVLAAKAASMIRDGSMQTLLLSAKEAVSAALWEHVVDPLTKLFQEMFETMSRKDHIVTIEELDQSKRALHRMLEDFSNSRKGNSLLAEITSTIKTKAAAGLDSVSAPTGAGGGGAAISGGTGAGAGAGVVVGGTMGGSGGSSVGGAGAGTGTGAGAGGGVGTGNAAAPGVGAGAVVTASHDNLSVDEVMEALMRSYENDMKNPFTGIVFGNLMTSMLIQMQKLKVHTESALLTMDQVLASNQLTMAGTAAMPAVLFFGVISYTFYRFWIPPAARPGQATLQLRLVMSDVERSLADVYSDVSSSSAMPASNSSNSVEFCTPTRRAPIFSSRVNSSPVPDPAEPVRPAAGQDYGLDLCGGRANSIDTVDSELLDVSSSTANQMAVVNRGLLCFHLTRFRISLGKLFLTDYWNASRKPSSYIPQSDSPSSSSSSPSSAATSWAHWWWTGPGGLLSGIFGWSLLVEGDTASTEYISICRDVTELVSPDSEISGDRKLRTAQRMRVSYQCLVSPVK